MANFNSLFNTNENDAPKKPVHPNVKQNGYIIPN